MSNYVSLETDSTQRAYELNEKKQAGAIGSCALSTIVTFCALLALGADENGCSAEDIATGVVFGFFCSFPCILSGCFMGCQEHPGYYLTALVGAVSLVANTALLAYTLTHCDDKGNEITGY